LPDFFTLEVKTSLRLPDHRVEGRLYLVISNATDRANIGGYAYLLQNGVLGGKPDSLLPLIPTLGFSWSW
jgi:hypothetical protein